LGKARNLAGELAASTAICGAPEVISDISYALLFLLCAGQTSSRTIRLQTDRLVYEIGADGLNRAFRDRLSGKNFLANPSSFMSIEKDGRRLSSTQIELEGENLRVRFGDSGVEVKVRVRTFPQYLTLELISVSDPSIASVELANLPLTLTKYVSPMLASCRDDEYAAAVVPLNIETHTYHGAGAVLLAEADRRVRLEGTKIALLGCPTTELLKRVEQVELEQGLPHPTLDGVWARTSSEQMKSYLFVDLSEDSADAMIDYAKAGGFSYIVVYDGVWDSSRGTYPVNLKNFPHGDAGLRAVSDKIHRAGLKFGMHNLDMVVDKSDALVHPVPASGFVMYPERRRSLAAAIGPRDTFLPTTTSPAGLLRKADKSRYLGRDLRLGDEIVTYDDIQTTSPYGFTGCQRGAQGTLAAAHPAGTVIDNFAEFIGFYVPDIKSDLYDRVAQAEAAALNRFAFDYIYPDGTGENLSFRPEPPVWYIYNLLISKLYGYTKREVMFAHAPPTDYSWHIFSRGNTTDYVHAGVIEHFDRESIAGTKTCIEDLLPFEFGWFGFLVHAPDADATRPREMEYAWSKALAFGAAMSLETNKKTLDANGRTPEIFAIIRNWEELKLQNYFPQPIREQMKKPGEEFTLERAADGQWQVLPVTYSPDKYVTGKDFWTVENRQDSQPLRVTIEAKPTLAEYGDPTNITLLDPARAINLNTSGSGPLGAPARQTKGLDFELKSSSTSFEVSARNHTDAPSGMGWGCAEVILDSVKDLRHHRALGTWVEGDVSGAYLHFVLEDDGRWSVRDYYVRLDFQGRKYVQIPEAAKGEVYEFAFPYSNYWAIRKLNFQTISRVYIFLTNLPPGAAARARFGRLEALKERPLALRNPGLSVNGEFVRFPIQLEADWYLEYSGTGKARVFDADGFTKAEVVPSGTVPALRHGANRIVFLGEAGRPAKVTFSTRGEPLR
jgi:hypothetical protein